MLIRTVAVLAAEVVEAGVLFSVTPSILLQVMGPKRAPGCQTRRLGNAQRASGKGLNIRCWWRRRWRRELDPSQSGCAYANKAVDMRCKV